MKEYNEYIEQFEKQLLKENSLFRLDKKFNEVSREYQSLMDAIPLDEIIINNDNVSAEELSNIIEKLNKYPEWKKSQKVLNDRYKAKEEFFNAFIDYLTLLDANRVSLANKDKLKLLLLNGDIFYFYLLPKELLDNVNLETAIMEEYSKDNYALLEHLLLDILGILDIDTKITNEDFNRFRLAFIDIKNKEYKYASKDLLELIKSEMEALELTLKANNRTNGLTDIDLLGNKINVDFYKDCASSIKYQYKHLKKVIELANKIDCIKLIIMYINIRQLNYIFNNINLLVEEFENDLAIVNSQENK